MAVHTELSPTEAADRLALRELFDGYAHCADRLPPLSRHLRQDRRALVLRRTEAHPRLERDAITRHGRVGLTAQQIELRQGHPSRGAPTSRLRGSIHEGGR